MPTGFAEWSDLPDLLSLLLAFILRGLQIYYTTMSPLYVPPNDSLSKFPIRPDTVSADLLHNIVLIAIVGSIFLLFFFHRLFPIWFREINILAAIWVWGCEACLVELMTDLFKKFVGRPRPMFYEMCGANTQYETCNPTVAIGTRNDLFQSWPSGHATDAMQGFLFTALLWKRGVVSSVSWVSTFAIGLSSIGFYIGATRIRDYKHHTDDVLAGFVIAALVCGVIWYRGHRRIFPKAKSTNRR